MPYCVSFQVLVEQDPSHVGIH